MNFTDDVPLADQPLDRNAKLDQLFAILLQNIRNLQNGTVDLKTVRKITRLADQQAEIVKRGRRQK
jgi:hypothetical protein